MFFNSKKKNTQPVCVKCRVIRSFVLCVLMLMILGFLLGEDAAYFRFLTPDFAATMIVGVGTVLFGWKVLEYYLSKKGL